MVNTRKIKKEMIEQLERAGKNYSFFIPLVDSYILHIEILEELHKDIAERGYIVEMTSGNGFTKTAPNESILLAQKEEVAMEKILDTLKLKDPIAAVGKDEDDYL